METLIFDENNVQKLRHPYRHTLLFHGKDNCYIELQQSKLSDICNVIMTIVAKWVPLVEQELLTLP
jgi:hypothetical protein